MTRYEAAVEEAIISEGIALKGWRFTVKSRPLNYNYSMLEVEVFEPRKRKPTTIWNVPYDMTRCCVRWDKAELLYNSHMN